MTAANDYAIWTGSPGDLQLVVRTGMHAPGTPPAVVFDWMDNFSINDAGQIACRGQLAGPGIIDGYNYSGRWVGGPGSLQAFSWTGMEAPGLPAGTTFGATGFGTTSLNESGDMFAVPVLEGPGVTPSNDRALYVGQTGALALVMRTGDPAPQAPARVRVAEIENVVINAERDCLFPVKFAGPGIDDTNDWAFYFGNSANPHIATSQR